MHHLEAHLLKLREAMVSGRTVAAHDALSMTMATMARLPRPVSLHMPDDWTPPTPAAPALAVPPAAFISARAAA